MKKRICRVPIVEIALRPLYEIAEQDVRSLRIRIDHFVRLPKALCNGTAARILELVFFSRYQVAIGGLLWRCSSRLLRLHCAVHRTDEVNATRTTHETGCVALRSPSHQANLTMSSLGSGRQAQAHALLRRFTISPIGGIVVVGCGYVRAGRHGFRWRMNVSPRSSAAQRYAIYQEIRGVGDALRSTLKTRGRAKETTFFR